jgi:hypothetical protein
LRVPGSKRNVWPVSTEEEDDMRKFIIEREIPQVGSLEREQLRAAAAKSNEALAKLAPRVQWQHSYVAGDRTFCVYLAEDEGVIREHAKLSGFPASRIIEISKVIDPSTAREPVGVAA